MPQQATPTSPRHRGWYFDQVNGRLAVIYNGTEVFDLDANDVTFPSGTTVNFDGAVDFDSTVDMSGGTVTLPTRTADFDLLPLVTSSAGASLLATETAGSFNRALGTNQFFLQGEVTNNETEVSVGWARFMLPDNYKDGGTITITAVTDIVGSGTLGSCTIDFEAYKQAEADGTVGSDLVSTAAQTINGTVGADSFTVTPTGLVAGDVLNIKMSTSVVVTDMANSNAEIYDLRATLQVDK